MSVTNPSATAVDPWDYTPPVQQSVRSGQISSKGNPIPDDWDADEEDEEAEPQQLWEVANNKAPMPELVLSSTNMSSSGPPPPAAFQPSLRILKRSPGTVSPAPLLSSTSESLADVQQKSYAEREAQYQAARERIFGSEHATTPPSPSHQSKMIASRPTAAKPEVAGSVGSNIARNPRGPDSIAHSHPETRGAGTGATSTSSGGFANRRGLGRK